MRALKIGYVLAISFLLALFVVTATFGFYPPPKGPKSPEYPRGTSLLEGDEYQDQYSQYDKQLKTYEDEQKTFLQDKIVGYTVNVVVFWLASLVVFVAIGLVFVFAKAEVVGAGYAFSALWAVVYGPIGFLMWYVNGLVRSFGGQAEQEFSSEPIFQAAAVVSILGVLVLTALGFVIFRRKAVTT